MHLNTLQLQRTHRASYESHFHGVLVLCWVLLLTQCLKQQIQFLVFRNNMVGLMFSVSPWIFVIIAVEAFERWFKT